MTAATPQILAIDLGTSGPKVALVRSDGEILAGTSRSVEIRFLPDGGAEQDPEEIWASVVDASQEVLGEANTIAEQVLGVAVTSQFFSLIPVDRDGRPVMNLIMWMDSRGLPYSQAIYDRHPEALKTWIDVHGLFPLPSGADSLSHMLFVKHAHPELWDRTHKVLEAMDYLILRLTGEPTANICTAFPLLLTDNRDTDPPRYDPGLIAMAGVDAEKLPDLVRLNSCVGTLRPAVAEELGLLPITKVFSGTNDTHAASIAAGTFRPGHGGVNIGSTGQILADAKAKSSDLDNDLLTMPSPIPGRHTVMAENGLAGKALDHFVTDVVFASDALADHSSDDLFSRLEQVLEGTAPGSGNLLFLPWLTGSGSPGANAKIRGAFLNLSLETGREQMVRAIVEGISFSLRWCLGAVERFAERRLQHLHFSGGGARSDGWAQILADVMGRPVRQLENAHYTGPRAAAFLAFVELGILGLDEHETICRVKHEYAPQAANRQLYDHLFAQFLAARESNTPIFEALNADD